MTLQVFIWDLSTTLAEEIIRLCIQAEIKVVGTVASAKQLLAARRYFRRIKQQNQNEIDVPAEEEIIEDAERKEPKIEEKSLIALYTDTQYWQSLLQTSDVVITPLLYNHNAAIDLLKEFEHVVNSKEATTIEEESESYPKFIAVSSVLTWGKNPAHIRGVSDDGSPLGHKEVKYKSRRPIPSCTELKTVETQILSTHKPGSFECYVIGAGLIYGGRESDFGLLMRDAWMNPEQDLIVPSLDETKSGSNLIPMIGVYDLALILFTLISSTPERNYLLAVDAVCYNITLRDICLGISILLGNGKIKSLPAEVEADLILENAEILAPLQLNIAFDTESTTINSLVPTDQWKHYQSGMLNNLEFYTQDFLECMDLRPLRTVIVGQPCSGKTKLSKELAKDYYLPYLDAKSIMEAFCSQEHMDPEVKKLSAAVLEWKESAALSEGSSIPDDLIVPLLRWKLSTPPCRNQGYILDGIPTAVSQAADIFAPLLTEEYIKNNNTDEIEAEKSATNENIDGAEDSSQDNTNNSYILRPEIAKLTAVKTILRPNRVIFLTAGIDILEARKRSLLAEVSDTESNTILETFRVEVEQFSSLSDELANFFEQQTPVAIEVNPVAESEVENEDGDITSNNNDNLTKHKENVEVLRLFMAKEDDYSSLDKLRGPLDRYMSQGGGKPFNFHPTNQEIEEANRLLKQAQEEAEAKEKESIRLQAESEAAELKKRIAAEQNRLDIISKEEQEILVTRAKPLREYLMASVMPALIEGLLEVSKVQPDDAIDYLAEYLFRKGRELEHLDK